MQELHYWDAEGKGAVGDPFVLLRNNAPYSAII